MRGEMATSVPTRSGGNEALDFREAVAIAKTVAPSMLTHIETACASTRSPITIPRTLDDLRSSFGGASYPESVKMSNLSRNKHVGQRKLCLALIEFLTEVHALQLRTTQRTTPLFVVYVGSSIVAALAANDLFPNDRFMCYDPSFDMTVDIARRELGPDSLKILDSRVATMTRTMSPRDAVRSLSSKPILLFTGQAAGRFHDSTCAYVLNVANLLPSMETAFVSDIRRSVHDLRKEHAISEDMVNQARWTLLLKVRFYCFKFRLPFALADDIRAEYATLADTSMLRDDHTVPYFGGMCMLQKYAPDPTTEMRLFGLNTPSMTLYDISEVESLLAPFNVVHRSRTTFKPYPAITRDGDERIPRKDVEGAAMRLDGSVNDGTGTYWASSFDTLGECCVIRDAVLVGDQSAGVSAFVRACARLNSIFAVRARRRSSRGKAGAVETYASWVLNEPMHGLVGGQRTRAAAHAPPRYVGSGNHVVRACLAITVGAAAIDS